MPDMDLGSERFEYLVVVSRNKVTTFYTGCYEMDRVEGM
jgi:hypothetical protein